jgi:hypothetical protein
VEVLDLHIWSSIKERAAVIYIPDETPNLLNLKKKFFPQKVFF